MENIAPDIEAIRRCEEQLLRPEFRTASDGIADLLADDFLEFGASGYAYSKAEVLEAVRGEAPFQRSMSDFAARRLSDDMVLVTYRCTRRVGDDGPSFDTLRSSLWQCRAGRWQLIFHQGTPVAAE